MNHSNTTKKDCQPVPDPAKAFLDHFDPARRSFVVGRFLTVIRAGTTNPAEVVSRVALFARQDRAAPWTTDDRADLFGALLDALAADPDGARRLAEHYLAWESLAKPDKTRRKLEKAEQFRRDWQRAQPPTDKQLSYLAALGWTGEVADRLTASDLIDRLQKGSRL